jgi:hypothetical protein
MGSGYRKVMQVSALGLCVAAALSMGQSCGSISPFLAAQFNQSLIGTVGNGPPPIINNNGNGNDNGNPDVLASVCDLPDVQRAIQVSIQNEALQPVDFSLTLVASAGPGGFVCDAQLQDYLDAGYRDAIVPGSGNNFVIGCDTITLLSGTRILTLEFGVNQGVAARLPANTDVNIQFPNAALPTIELRRADSASTLIPLPEVIVAGSGDPDFVCIGNDLCTQRGFVYVNNAGFPVGKPAEASRIQGTICAENFGTAPEFRLDKTFDATSQAFQFGRGGAIVFGVLDRAGDPLNSTRNQVSWLVVDENDATIQFPDR